MSTVRIIFVDYLWLIRVITAGIILVIVVQSYFFSAWVNLRLFVGVLHCIVARIYSVFMSLP